MSKSSSSLKTIASISVIGFFVFMGLTIITPVLPAYARFFGASETLIGVLVAGFGISRVVLGMPSGVIADRYNRTHVIVYGLLIIVGSSIVAGLAPNFAVLLVGRFLEGVGSALAMTAANTILSASTSISNRGRAMSLFGGALVTGAIIGPLVGGRAAVIWGFSAPFFVYAAVSAIAIGVAFAALKEPYVVLPARRVKMPNLSEVGNVLKNPSVILVNLTIFVFYFAWLGINNTAVPLLAFDNLHVDEAALGNVLGLTSAFALVTVMSSGIISDRAGRRIVAMICLFLLAAATYVLPTSRSLEQLTLIMAFFGLALGLGNPMFAWVADLAPPERLGTTIGVSRTISDLGLVVGPFASGYLIEISRTEVVQPLPFIFTSLLLFAVGIILVAAKDPVRAIKPSR